MSTKAKAGKSAKPNVNVRDMKPKKDVKGGIRKAGKDQDPV